MRFLDKVFRNTVFLAHLPGQRRIPYIPEEKLWAIRDARLRNKQLVH